MLKVIENYTNSTGSNSSEKKHKSPPYCFVLQVVLASMSNTG